MCGSPGPEHAPTDTIRNRSPSYRW
jgi:hypothetical protein